MPTITAHIPEVSGQLQALPFQCRSSVWSFPLPTEPVTPTAQASVAETTVIAESCPAVPASTFGLATWLQALPFQCRIRVWNSVASWVFGLAPHALSPPHRGDELAAQQRMADLSWHMRAAYEGVGVVDVSDVPP